MITSAAGNRLATDLTGAETVDDRLGNLPGVDAVLAASDPLLDVLELFSIYVH